MDILSTTKKDVTLITNKFDIMDYIKYKKQYGNINMIVNNDFHDIIDKKTLYHCGASFKDLGNKCFEISKIEDKDILDII